jgi:hypothetical protein
VSSRKEEKLRARAARLARERELHELRARRRRRRQAALVAVTGVVAAAALGVDIAGGNGAASTTAAPPVPAVRLQSLAPLGRLEPPGPPGPFGPEGVPIPNAPQLAEPSAASPPRSVDGIRCLGNEQLRFHIHAHVTVYVDGHARQLPAGIGIINPQISPTTAGPYVGAGSCFYWLHTHAADGIIHIESPEQRTFTLGDFFEEWNQPLTAGQVGSAKGAVTVIVNGKVWKGSPRNVPLGSHENLQVEVGTPLVAPETINWSITGL